MPVIKQRKKIIKMHEMERIERLEEEEVEKKNGRETLHERTL